MNSSNTRPRFHGIMLVILVLCVSGWAQNQATLTQVRLSLTGNDPQDDWRLTKNVANNLLQVDLFGDTYASAPLVYKNDTGFWNIIVCTDPAWNRLIYGDYNNWIKEYGSWGSGQDQFRRPMGITRNSRGKLFIADAANNRIVVCRIKFKTDNQNPPSTYQTFIEHVTYIDGPSGNGLNVPFDVAWDDGGDIYVGDDVLWIADTGNDRILKYSINTDDTFTLQAEFGASGSGIDQFKHPKSIAVGRTNGYNDDNVYVADAGNQRIVWLEDMPAGIVWRGEYDLPLGPKDFTSVETDWYGGLWVTDAFQHQITKLDRELLFLGSYGTRGVGQSIGLVNGPTDYATYFEFQNVGGVKSWFGHPGVFLSESWGKNSGGVCYEMGTNVTYAYAALSAIGNHVATAYIISDYSEITLRIRRTSDDALIKTLFYKQIRPYGYNFDSWDGTDNNSDPAPADDYYLKVRAKSLYTNAAYVYGSSDNFYWPGLISKTGIDQNGELPMEYALFQNSPNPFNPQTAIEYHVPESGNATIEVYDFLGRKIRTLVNQYKKAGRYRVVWNGRNQIEELVRTGVYFYRMKAGSFTATRKMILLR